MYSQVKRVVIRGRSGYDSTLVAPPNFQSISGNGVRGSQELQVTAANTSLHLHMLAPELEATVVLDVIRL